ncbi:hypothetical protein PT974_05167 [Cladobotryum mycophilum]|uniref:Uncharacterized protein n=1 Tax=Cladobotryum mycophilum TaxID=491253 RepID=A0ABR0SRX4_9HYPO
MDTRATVSIILSGILVPLIILAFLAWFLQHRRRVAKRDSVMLGWDKLFAEIDTPSRDEGDHGSTKSSPPLLEEFPQPPGNHTAKSSRDDGDYESICYSSSPTPKALLRTPSPTPPPSETNIPLQDLKPPAKAYIPRPSAIRSPESHFQAETRTMEKQQGFPQATALSARITVTCVSIIQPKIPPFIQ